MGSSETTNTSEEREGVEVASEGAGESDIHAPTPGPVATSSIVEAMLVATDSPISAKKMAGVIGDVSAAQVRECIAELNAAYEQSTASFRIDEIAKGYQILTLPEYNVWLRKLLKVRTESKLSQAALETLAVIAYKQPALRVQIEEIRGVAVGEVVNRLREMNLVKIVGRAEELGRPLLYGTTKRFLEVFGLGSIQDLPQVEELPPPEKQRKRSKPTEQAPPDFDDTATEDANDAFARIAEAARADDDNETERGDATSGTP